MKVILKFSACVWLLSAAVVTAADPATFRYSRTIAVEQLTAEELVGLRLDSAIYNATRLQLPDVRILDEQNAEVPFWLDQLTKTKAETWYEWSQPKNLTLDPTEGMLEIVVDLKANVPSASAIGILTPLADFRQRVRVFGDAAGTWKPLVEDGLIFDYSRYMNVRDRELPLPANNYRRFRIVIDAATAEHESQLMELTRRLRGKVEEDRTEKVQIDRRPFRIDRIEFRHDSKNERTVGKLTIPYPANEVDIKQDKEAKQTQIDITTKRESLTSLTIENSTRNFSREARVEIPVYQGVRRRWETIANATISRLKFRDLNREQLTISFPEQRQAEFRVVIENKDNPALDITGVQPEGIVDRLVFLAQPKTKYHLVYGSKKAEAPDYDTATIRASLEKNYEPLEASLGEAVENFELDERGGGFERFINNPIVWITTSAVLVVALGWGLFHAVRRVDDLPKS
jgi:hypothetical protein